MLKSALKAKFSEKKPKKRIASKQSMICKQITSLPRSRKRKISTKTEESLQNFKKEILSIGKQLSVDPTTVRKGIEGVIKFTSENPKLKNKLFDDEEFPLFVQINSIKVPTGAARIIRLPLKHSLLKPDSEVCLIVPDVKGIPNKEHEKHLEHYEKLLKEKGVDNIKKIMTFHEFRTEYETFEMKNRLVELYDMFLVDGKISGKTVSKCGKIFYKKRKVPTAVKLQATKLKEHIDQTLKKTPLYLNSNGDSFVTQFGHSKMQLNDLVDNVFCVLQGLQNNFPGGFGNIRSLNLFTFRGLSIPIYATLKNQNEVDIMENVKEAIPVVKEVSGELTTRLHSGVTVKPTGEVIVHKLKDLNSLETDRPVKKRKLQKKVK